MKKIIIDGKEYWQQDEKSIPKIPMPISENILSEYLWEFCKECSDLKIVCTCMDDEDARHNNMPKQ